MVKIGKFFFGGDFIINKVVEEVDLLIFEGFIEFYFFVGFFGGCKFVLLGIFFYKIIMVNYFGEFINDKYFWIGNFYYNMVYYDMVYVVRKVGLKFILNVVLDEDKYIIGFFVGDFEVVYK